jgi:hypothetical protein
MPRAEPVEDAAEKATQGNEDDTCAGAQAFAGSWAWTTSVVGAKKASMLGTNGHYRMQVTTSGCDLQVDLRKTGFSTRMLKPEKVQKGTQVFRYGPLKGFDGAAKGQIHLVNERGASSSMSITMIADSGALWGSWSQEDDAWTAGEMWGALKGRRDSEERLKYSHWNDQPCTVQCTLGCSVPTHRKAGTLSTVPLAECSEACEQSPRSPPQTCQGPSRADAEGVLPKGCKIRSEKASGYYKVSCRRLRKKLKGWRLAHESADNTHFSETFQRTYTCPGWKLSAKVECTHQWDDDHRHVVRTVCAPKNVRLRKR